MNSKHCQISQQCSLTPSQQIWRYECKRVPQISIMSLCWLTCIPPWRKLMAFFLVCQGWHKLQSTIFSLQPIYLLGKTWGWIHISIQPQTLWKFSWFALARYHKRYTYVCWYVAAFVSKFNTGWVWAFCRFALHCPCSEGISVSAENLENENVRHLQLYDGEAVNLTALRTEMVITETECARVCVREATCAAVKVKKICFALNAFVHTNSFYGHFFCGKLMIIFLVQKCNSEQATQNDNGTHFEAMDLCGIPTIWTIHSSSESKLLLQIEKQPGAARVLCRLFQEPETGSGEPEIGFFFRKIPNVNALNWDGHVAVSARTFTDTIKVCFCHLWWCWVMAQIVKAHCERKPLHSFYQGICSTTIIQTQEFLYSHGPLDKDWPKKYQLFLNLVREHVQFQNKKGKTNNLLMDFQNKDFLHSVKQRFSWCFLPARRGESCLRICSFTANWFMGKLELTGCVKILCISWNYVCICFCAWWSQLHLFWTLNSMHWFCWQGKNKPCCAEPECPNPGQKFRLMHFHLNLISPDKSKSLAVKFICPWGSNSGNDGILAVIRTGMKEQVWKATAGKSNKEMSFPLEFPRSLEKPILNAFQVLFLCKTIDNCSFQVSVKLLFSQQMRFWASNNNYWTCKQMVTPGTYEQNFFPAIVGTQVKLTSLQTIFCFFVSSVGKNL